MRINVPFSKLKHIVHLADIHIRLFRRHDEYQIVFDRLYADIKAAKLEDFIIVLAGDIVHAKTDMSPELIEITSAFLRNLADIAPTIMIAGNHDCNLANVNRLDSLTPIVNSLAHSDLYYIKDSDIVYVADTSFSVCSIFEDPSTWLSVNDIAEPVSTKVALYHGPVHGARTDTGFAITSDKVRCHLFDGYDMVLLGDIHTYQTLQEYDSRNAKPIIQYVGSLIQQNQGESLRGHGWCLWDVPSRTMYLREIKNDFGYVTLDVVNGKYNLPNDIPKNIRLRMFTGDLEPVEINKIIALLKTKHTITELSVAKDRNKKSIVRTSNIKLTELSDLTNVNTQNQFITDWVMRNDETLTQEILGEILQINADLNSRITHDDQSRNIHWKPVKFTFSNMFSYGENNEIYFDSMKGIYGLFAPNASGKSSVMDSLMFCLYDKTPRAFKGDHIINNRKDTFECELLFKINDEIYGIHRSGTRKKNGDVKVDVNFWRVENGAKVILNAEDRRTTNAVIRNYVGSYEDFVLTTMSGQVANSLFIDKSHSERKDLLNQFMGLNVFDKLHELANDELKEISGVLKRFKKLEITTEIATVISQSTSQKQELESLNIELESLNVDKSKLENSILSLQQQKKSIPVISKNITQFNEFLELAKKQLKDIEQDISVVTVRSETLTKEIELVQGDLEKYDLDLLSNQINEYNKLSALLVDENANLRLLNAKIHTTINLKEKLSKYKYNPLCEVCAENNKSIILETNKVNTELDELYASKLILEDNITDLIKKIDLLKDAKEDFDDAHKLRSSIYTLNNDLEKDKLTIEKYKLERDKKLALIDSIKADIELYKNNENDIVFNQTIDSQLKGVLIELEIVKVKLVEVERKIRTAFGELKALEQHQTRLVAEIKEAEEMEVKHRAYSLYTKAMGRDGIPYELIGKTIPLIEDEINNILSQIVEFRVELEVDGKNINSKLVYDSDKVWPLENSSGMERFVSSVAIRLALMNASNLPKPNFMVIDEGFGVLDADHLQSMNTLFNLLKTHLDFIFIVSHLDKMRDMVDSLIEIKKEDGYSRISV